MKRKEDLKKCGICGNLTSRVAFNFKQPHKMYKCRFCESMFLHPLPDAGTIREFYCEEYFRNHNIQYLKGLDGNSIESRIRLAQESVKYEIHPFKRTGKLLEVGCASGFFLKAAERLGWETMGIEISEFACLFASQRLGLNVMNSRLEDAGLPKNHFDVIVMFMVLEHFPDPVRILQIAKESLKTGGIMIIKIPNYRCVESVIFKSKWHQLSFPYHLYIFSPASMKFLADKLNLSIDALGTYRHFSNYINPVSNHICGRMVKESVNLKEKAGRFKHVLKFLYKSVFSVLDERLLMGEQIRVVLRKND
ncbi:MAG: class I SAM-dependent methyltransferase [Candidatus Omnitrophica bacterium]|nr:class I SAM-dependent methyltransferase [Candidatus Omnitrophota bacterium]MDD5553405.1 class I SAM-dependent methyltransferase [Candidatus Omnitrophota bacterium]